MMVACGSASRMALAVASARARVLLGIGLGAPEIAVGLVPDFPEHVPPLEVFGRRRRPARESRDAVRMLRRSGGLVRFARDGIRAGHRFLVKGVRVIENEDAPASRASPGWPAAPHSRPSHIRPCLGSIASQAKSIRTNLNPAAAISIQVPLMAGDEVDIHPNPRRQDRFRQFRPAAQQRQQAHQHARLSVSSPTDLADQHRGSPAK